MPRAFLIKNKKEKKVERRKEKPTAMETDGDSGKVHAVPLCPVGKEGVRQLLPVSEPGKAAEAKETRRTPAGRQAGLLYV